MWYFRTKNRSPPSRLFVKVRIPIKSGYIFGCLQIFRYAFRQTMFMNLDKSHGYEQSYVECSKKIERI